MTATDANASVPAPCTAPTEPGFEVTEQADGAEGGGRQARMHIDAPVRSLEMLDLQVAAGATEVYLGLAAAELNTLTFNAYAARRSEQPTQVSSAKLLRSLIAEAHTQGLTVNFSANASHLPQQLHQAFVDHVRTALDLGADRVIVANVGLLRALRAAGVTAPLVASGTMGVTTSAYAEWLARTFDVSRVVLPHSVTLGEAAVIARVPDVEVEVQVQTGAGLSCGRCTIWDDPQTSAAGLGCRAGYEVTTPSGQVLNDNAFLDGGTDCALCDVPGLVAAGVTALKIPGRESPNLRVNAKITQLYRRVLDKTNAGAALPRVIEQIDAIELLWQMAWVPRLCDQQRCRFRATPITSSYI